jgi:hypothetical protein
MLTFFQFMPIILDILDLKNFLVDNIHLVYLCKWKKKRNNVWSKTTWWRQICIFKYVKMYCMIGLSNFENPNVWTSSTKLMKIKRIFLKFAVKMCDSHSICIGHMKQHYVINLASNLRKVSGFLPVSFTVYSENIVASGV